MPCVLRLLHALRIHLRSTRPAGQRSTCPAAAGTAPARVAERRGWRVRRRARAGGQGALLTALLLVQTGVPPRGPRSAGRQCVPQTSTGQRSTQQAGCAPRMRLESTQQCPGPSAAHHVALPVGAQEEQVGVRVLKRAVLRGRAAQGGGSGGGRRGRAGHVAGASAEDRGQRRAAVGRGAAARHIPSVAVQSKLRKQSHSRRTRGVSEAKSTLDPAVSSSSAT